MGVGAGLYMCDVVKKFTFALSSPDEFLSHAAYAQTHRRSFNGLVFQDNAGKPEPERLNQYAF